MNATDVNLPVRASGIAFPKRSGSIGPASRRDAADWRKKIGFFRPPEREARKRRRARALIREACYCLMAASAGTLLFGFLNGGFSGDAKKRNLPSQVMPHGMERAAEPAADITNLDMIDRVTRPRRDEEFSNRLLLDDEGARTDMKSGVEMNPVFRWK